jgi:hypothetical protein
MSYKKVQQLADKFTKTANPIEYYSYPEKTDPAVNNFMKNIRTALNELEGDLMTLRYRDASKDFTRAQFKELGNFWRDCVELYKSLDEYNLAPGIQKFIDFLKDKKDWLAKTILALQQHMKNTEVDFVPGPGLSQARADGLKEIIRAVNSGSIEYFKNKNNSYPSVFRKHPADLNSPSSTFVPVPATKINRDEATGVATPRPKKEAL